MDCFRFFLNWGGGIHDVRMQVSGGSYQKRTSFVLVMSVFCGIALRGGVGWGGGQIFDLFKRTYFLDDSLIRFFCKIL